MKFDVTYTCGHTGVVSLFGKWSERERRIASIEKYDICPDCYREKTRKENKEMGLVLELGIEPCSISIILVAKGDSYSYKDELKELGFKYGEYSPNSGAFLGIGSSSFKAWVYRINAVDDDSAEQVTAMIAKVKKVTPDAKASATTVNSLDAALMGELVRMKKKEIAEKSEKQSARQATKPEILRGKKFNGKIYGTDQRGYSIYIDDEKTDITLEEKAVIETWLGA